MCNRGIQQINIWMIGKPYAIDVLHKALIFYKKLKKLDRFSVSDSNKYK